MGEFSTRYLFLSAFAGLAVLLAPGCDEQSDENGEEADTAPFSDEEAAEEAEDAEDAEPDAAEAIPVSIPAACEDFFFLPASALPPLEWADPEVGTKYLMGNECCTEPGQAHECWMQDAWMDGAACNSDSQCISGSCDTTLGLCNCTNHMECGCGQGICTPAGKCGPSWCNGYKVCSCSGGCVWWHPEPTHTPAEECGASGLHCCEGGYPMDSTLSGFCADTPACDGGGEACSTAADCTAQAGNACVDPVCIDGTCYYLAVDVAECASVMNPDETWADQDLPCCCNVDADCPALPCVEDYRCDLDVLSPTFRQCIFDWAPVGAYCDGEGWDPLGTSTACMSWRCNADHECVQVFHDGVPCNADNDGCTQNDFCLSGTCVAGPPVNCDDNNVCTGPDTCVNVPAPPMHNSYECSNPPRPDANAREYGYPDTDPCSNRFCVGGILGPPVPVDCGAPDDDCNQWSCDPGGADDNCDANIMLIGEPCDADGNLCTAPGTCQDGGDGAAVCVAGPPVICDQPVNECLIATCNPATGTCDVTPNDGVSCGDNPCKPGICAGGFCWQSTVDCTSAADNCNNGVCVPDGVVGYDCVAEPIPDGTPCNADNDGCTVNDSCQAGACTPGPAPDCDDGNACTANACQSTGNNSYVCTETVLADEPCDDGDPCTHDDVCTDDGVCQGTQIVCASTACVTRECNGTSSCTETLMDSSTVCGSMPCPWSACESGEFHDYPLNCTRYCSGVDDTCDTCECDVTTETCGVGAGNQCCQAECHVDFGGCYTAAGSCGVGGDTCGEHLLELDQLCVGCGPPDAAGTCEAGDAFVCDDDVHDECAEYLCNEESYYCVDDGMGWFWSTDPACDDGDPCTYDGVCVGGVCQGSTIVCEDTICTYRDCDGTDTCAVTPKSEETVCGSTACPADYCSGNTFYDYLDDCTRYCSGEDDTCNDCSCTATTTACTAGGCCEAVCSAITGCATVAGSCGPGESCGLNVITLEATCEGCGAAGAEGTCSGGETHLCDAANQNMCQTVTCGGTTYRCTNAGGSWAWRTGTACDDGDPCTYDGVCVGEVCQGTTIVCDDTICTYRDCDGTDTCAVTPKPEETVCGSTDCPENQCSGNTFYDYPDDCTRYCSGEDDTCNTCECTATTTACTAGGCCEAACSSATGCHTTAGSCADVCGAATLHVNRTCQGCGANGADGACGGGTATTCGPSHQCQTMSCGGTTYRCTNAGGAWEWRPSAQTACDDGDPCTYDDVCSGGVCQGTTIVCDDTLCLTRECNGTSTCTETPKPEETVCGSTDCPENQCSGNTFYDYPDDCTRYCSGEDDTCNTCECTATTTACGAGGCCVAGCSSATGCHTTPGSCADVCDAATLHVNRMCQNCGPNNASGTCGGGQSHTCNSEASCETQTCGGTTYHCTNAGGSWAWRESTACDDGNACTYDDVCSGGVCQGTAITCNDTLCLTRECNGTSTCTETPKPEGTFCGSTACPADYCSGNTFYDYLDYCTRGCSGVDDTCNTCECTAAATSCGAGGCCVAGCNAVSGCLTSAGFCGDSCTANTLNVNRVCQNCGPANATGTCGGGTYYLCNSSNQNLCQTVSCGGTTYRCTNVGGVWRWRTGTACDDGDYCTEGTACSGESCTGGWAADRCGDGICNCGETSDTCPADCGPPPPVWTGNVIPQTSTTQGNTLPNLCNIYYRRTIFVTTYSAAEISAAFGGATSATISAMRFHVTQQPAYQPLPSYAIGMKNTTNAITTNNSGASGGNFTMVKSQANESFFTGSWKTFNFTTPFQWNGQNLAVAWAWGQCPTSWSSTGQNPIGAGTSYTSWQDGAGAYLVTDFAGTSRNYRPVIQLYGGAAAGDPNSCVGNCNGMAPGGCWCDSDCHAFGDCCSDVCSACGYCGVDPNYSCVGNCNGMAPGGCWCDSDCHFYGDCCPDVCSACGYC